MKYNKYVILIAGGHGTRMGVDLPKQFILVNGKRLLHHTFLKFVESIEDIKVILVLPSEYMEDWKVYCSQCALHYPHKIIEGGFTRFHSVQNALNVVPDNSIVAIHDGVRPLLSKKMIKEMFDKFEREKLESLIPVIPSYDTLRAISKENEDLSAIDIKLDRSMIYSVQTPQLFSSELIKKAYQQPYSCEFTDDSSVAQAFGIKINFCIGEKYNVKITTQEDLPIAKMLL